MKTVMLSEARESILSAVLKVVLYSLGSAQSALFLQHGLATQRALVSKVSRLPSSSHNSQDNNSSCTEHLLCARQFHGTDNTAAFLN